MLLESMDIPFISMLSILPRISANCFFSDSFIVPFGFMPRTRPATLSCSPRPAYRTFFPYLFTRDLPVVEVDLALSR